VHSDAFYERSERPCKFKIGQGIPNEDFGQRLDIFLEPLNCLRMQFDAKAHGFKTILVYCVGPPDCNPRCWHWAAVPLDRLPDWDWYDICAHLKCTKCGSVGWVDPRPNLSEVIDFNKGTG
jgi:hypothetical protein